jgi:hypothetical protein
MMRRRRYVSSVAHTIFQDGVRGRAGILYTLLPFQNMLPPRTETSSCAYNCSHHTIIQARAPFYAGTSMVHCKVRTDQSSVTSNYCHRFLSELHSFSRLFIRMFFSMAASRLARADAHHHIHHGRMPWFDVFMIGIIIIIVIGSIRGKHHLLFSPLIALSI